ARGGAQPVNGIGERELCGSQPLDEIPAPNRTRFFHPGENLVHRGEPARQVLGRGAANGDPGPVDDGEGGGKGAPVPGGGGGEPGPPARGRTGEAGRRRVLGPQGPPGGADPRAVGPADAWALPT